MKKIITTGTLIVISFLVFCAQSQAEEVEESMEGRVNSVSFNTYVYSETEYMGDKEIAEIASRFSIEGYLHKSELNGRMVSLVEVEYKLKADHTKTIAEGGIIISNSKLTLLFDYKPLANLILKDILSMADKGGQVMDAWAHSYEGSDMYIVKVYVRYGTMDEESDKSQIIFDIHITPGPEILGEVHQTDSGTFEVIQSRLKELF